MDTNVLYLFDESDTILSIIKKFKKSKDKEKLQILKSLETFKINNDTYSQALAIIYKKENLKNINEFQNKQKVTLLIYLIYLNHLKTYLYLIQLFFFYNFFYFIIFLKKK